MYIVKTLKNGVRVWIIVRRKTKERLRTKCFRGLAQPLAGNFSHWESAEGLFNDPEMMKQFLAELSEVWSDQDFSTHSVSLVHTTPVGWESSAPLESYAPEDLERFKPNRKSSGLRVKPTRIDLLAPQTNELTIVYEFKPEDGQAVAIIHSIYPGRDIGNLDGDVTNREKRIFFDWNHPGKP